MLQIGYLDDSRLQNIPKRARAAHEFCFYLHDLIAQMTASAERSGINQLQIVLRDEDDVAALQACENPIEFLSQTGRHEEERKLAVSHICAALFPDMLHFIHAGLVAFEKRKFTLAFACLRKPFKEGLPLIALMCADEEDFFQKFRKDPVGYFDGRSFNGPTKKDAFEKAVLKCPDLFPMSSDRLHSLIFDGKNESGFSGLFDKAMHLVTANSNIKTDPYNFNFIFKHPTQDDIYDTSYEGISYILLCLHLMQLELMKRFNHPTEGYLKQLNMRAVGTYQATFLPGKSDMVVALNDTLGELMKCPVCHKEIRIKKSTAPRFFITEILECNHCGNEHQFPLSWLLSNNAEHK